MLLALKTEASMIQICFVFCKIYWKMQQRYIVLSLISNFAEPYFVIYQRFKYMFGVWFVYRLEIIEDF